LRSGPALRRASFPALTKTTLDPPHPVSKALAETRISGRSVGTDRGFRELGLEEAEEFTADDLQDE